MSAAPRLPSLFEMDYASEKGLQVVGYLTYVAVSLEPLQSLMNGRLVPVPTTVIGLLSFLAVPVLFFCSDRCSAGSRPLC